MAALAKFSQKRMSINNNYSAQSLSCKALDMLKSMLSIKLTNSLIECYYKSGGFASNRYKNGWNLHYATSASAWRINASVVAWEFMVLWYCYVRGNSSDVANKKLHERVSLTRIMINCLWYILRSLEAVARHHINVFPIKLLWLFLAALYWYRLQSFLNKSSGKCK